MELAAVFQHLWAGLLLLASVETWLAVTAGVAAGLVVGALPGLSATMGVALLSPLTFFLPPLVGIPFLVGVYKGADVGGFVPAILIRTPGTNAAAATLLDGYPLAQKGYPNKALQTALTSSVTADCLSDFILLFSAPFLAIVAKSLGVPERFTIIVLALAIVGSFIGVSPFRGLASAFLGLILASVGVDTVTGSQRFLFDTVQLSDGFGILPALIGLFAMSEVMRMAVKVENVGYLEIRERTRRDDYLSWKEFRSLWPTILRATGIGSLLGAAPGIGPSSTAFVSYSVARRASKNPEEFGKGSLEGISASEAGNSAVGGPNLIPLLTLGIPGSLVAAVLYSAFLAQGMQPGPRLFEEQGDLVYGLILSLIGANVIVYFLGKGFMQMAKFVVNVPRHILAPAIAFIAVAGTYSVGNSYFDVGVMLAFGLLGFFMDRYKFPTVPLIIALILGRSLEVSLLQSMVIFRGDLTRFLDSPVCAVSLGLTVFVLWLGLRRLRRRETGGATVGSDTD